jgi:maleylacetate reductase
MDPFLFEIARLRVVFGPGARNRIAAEVQNLGARHAITIVDPSQAGLSDQIQRDLGARSAGVYDKVAQHVPAELAAAASAFARDREADCCIAVGGGSAIGLAKAIALETRLPIIALPTTYAGSEMTPVWGLTTAGVKQTGKDPIVQPRAVIYDSELTAKLPPHIAGPSGINALAHCVEGMYAENANPMISTFAQEGVRALARALPRVCRQPPDADALGEAQYGACLAGIVLGSVGMSLHHKLCHTLGGSFNTPHAETHAVVLPYVTAYNLSAASDARRRLSEALGTPKPALALWELGQAVGAPRSLQALGLTAADIERAAELATNKPYYNPRPFTRESIQALLEQAWRGAPPQESAAA